MLRTYNKFAISNLVLYKDYKRDFLVFRIFSEFEQINSAKNGICFFTFSIIVFLFKKQEKFINFLCESWIILLLDAWLRIFFCGSGLQAMTGRQTSNWKTEKMVLNYNPGSICMRLWPRIHMNETAAQDPQWKTTQGK